MSEIKAVITLNRTEFPIIVPWSGSDVNSAQIGVSARESTIGGVKLIDMPNPPADLGYSWKISRFRNGQVSVGQPGSPGKSEAVLAVRDLRTLTAEAELWLQLDRNGEAVANATLWVPLIQGYTVATDSPGSRPNLAKPDFDRLVAAYPDRWLLREGFLPKFIGTKEEMFELRDSDSPPPSPPPPPPDDDDEDEGDEEEAPDDGPIFGRHRYALPVRVSAQHGVDTGIYLVSDAPASVTVSVYRSVETTEESGEPIHTYEARIGAFNPFVRNLWRDLGHETPVDLVVVESDRPLAACAIWQTPKDAPVDFAGFPALPLGRE